MDEALASVASSLGVRLVPSMSGVLETEFLFAPVRPIKKVSPTPLGSTASSLAVLKIRF